MKYFVFSDLHSCVSKLEETLDKYGYDSNNPNHKLLFLGDAFDKGKEHFKTYQFFKNAICNHKLIWVLGNHDYYLLNSLSKGKVSKFTKDTIRDIALGLEPKAKDYSDEECIKVLKDNNVDTFIKNNIIHYFEFDNYVFAHGFIPFDKTNNKYDENWRNAFDKEWIKVSNLNGMKMVLNGIRIPNKTFVCGHVGNIKMHGSNETFRADGVIGLDGNCYKSGILNMIIIDSDNGDIKFDPAVTKKSLLDELDYPEKDAFEYSSDYVHNQYNCASSFMEFPEEYKNDREFVLEALDINEFIFEFLPEKFHDDKEIALKAISLEAENIRHISNKLSDDYDVIMEALSSGRADTLEYASKRLKDDYNLVLYAVSKSSGYEYFFEDDKEYGKYYNDALTYASERLKDNKEIALISVRNNPESLSIVSERLKDDYDVVMEAVQSNGKALEYASKRLKNDKNIVLVAASNFYICEEDFDEYYEYEEYLGKNENILSFVSDELKNDRDVILAMIKNDSLAYFTIPEKFKYDMDIIKMVLDSDSCLKDDILEEVKDDKKLLEAIEEL